MNKTIPPLISIVIIVLSSQFNSKSQTIEKKLLIVLNDQTIGGTFNIEVQVKETSLLA